MAEKKMIATRVAYGEAMVELGKENPNIYVVDVDIAKSCNTDKFAKALPEQHVNVGIAEQNACGYAVGLASTGKIPFVTTYAVFGSMRMCEQIRQSVCYPKMNVKIACSHGGLTSANDGASHQGIEDMAIMRSLANMTVVAPADYVSAKALTRAVAEHEGPCYIRFTRDAVPIIYDEDAVFELGKANTLREGSDVCLIGIGDTVCIALDAAEQLEKEGIKARVLDMHTLKPLDAEAVKAALLETGRVITIEDHNVLNGLGSAVCEVAAKLGCGRVHCIGIPDEFGESGEYRALLASRGITAEAMVKAAKELMEN